MSVSAAGLLERERELARVAGALESAGGRAGRLVVVEGLRGSARAACRGRKPARR